MCAPFQEKRSSGGICRRQMLSVARAVGTLRWDRFEVRRRYSNWPRGGGGGGDRRRGRGRLLLSLVWLVGLVWALSAFSAFDIVHVFQIARTRLPALWIL